MNRIFYTEVKRNKLPLWNLDSKLQIKEKAISYKGWFFENGCKNTKMIKSKSKAPREKWEKILEKTKNDMLKLYGHVLRVGDDVWPKRVSTWQPGERKIRERPEMKLEKGSGKGDVAEQSKNWRRSKSVNMEKGNWEPVNGWTLEKLLYDVGNR